MSTMPDGTSFLSHQKKKKKKMVRAKIRSKDGENTGLIPVDKLIWHQHFECC